MEFAKTFEAIQVDTITTNTAATIAMSPITANITGDVTGDLTGDVTGDLTGDVTGDLTGNVTGNVLGDTTGTHIGAWNPTAGNISLNAAWELDYPATSAAGMWAAAQTFTLYTRVIGTSVVIELGAVSAVTNAAATATFQIGNAAAYPTRPIVLPLLVEENAARAFGSITISAAGVCVVFPDAVGGNFTNGAAGGWPAGTLSYLI